MPLRESNDAATLMLSNNIDESRLSEKAGDVEAPNMCICISWTVICNRLLSPGIISASFAKDISSSIQVSSHKNQRKF